MNQAGKNNPAYNHGHSFRGKQSPTYRTWASMLTRCNNPKRQYYPLYGGRGIVVCERWKTFSNFLLDMGERPVGLTLDRIDNNGNYEPGNCRWATWSEQLNNRSDFQKKFGFGAAQENKQKLLDFCLTPRLTVEVTTHLQLHEEYVKRLVRQLRAAKQVSTRLVRYQLRGGMLEITTKEHGIEIAN